MHKAFHKRLAKATVKEGFCIFLPLEIINVFRKKQQGKKKMSVIVYPSNILSYFNNVIVSNILSYFNNVIDAMRSN